MARGFILKPFTYLRDAWNWLDFIVIALAWVDFIDSIFLFFFSFSFFFRIVSYYRSQHTHRHTHTSFCNIFILRIALIIPWNNPAHTIFSLSLSQYFVFVSHFVLRVRCLKWFIRWFVGCFGASFTWRIYRLQSAAPHSTISSLASPTCNVHLNIFPSSPSSFLSQCHTLSFVSAP